MEWNYRDDLPIYTQLVEQLKKAITSGALPPGGRLQSVRDMAMDAGVNPNTMQRALAELEQQGLVHTRRTSGRFVTEDTEVIRREGELLAKTITEGYLTSMKELGFSPADAAELVKKYSEEL